MCSLVLLLFLIGGYNTVLAMREQRDEIARLTAELEGSKMTVSALKEQQAKKTENTAAEALKGRVSLSLLRSDQSLQIFQMHHLPRYRLLQRLSRFRLLL